MISIRWITDAIYKIKKRFKERMLSSVAKKWSFLQNNCIFFRYENCKMRAMILIYVC